ncbi:MAG: hypothetical protein QOH89_3234 [Pseudonocardiales bacterium]|nr:hypothetical protein [Pseudonocardiales bacterium]
MSAVQRGTVSAMGGALALLAVLAVTDGLGAAGWLAGAAAAGATIALLAAALRRSGADGLHLPNRITLTRAMLVTGVAALVADRLVTAAPHTTSVVAIATVALVLDAVDGFVARRTASVTAVGARFDMEVDAFLIFVLSGYAATLLGPWVLAIGAARYAYVAFGWTLPELRSAVPPRYWRKVVAAIQGIVLTVVAAQLLPPVAGAAATAVALALLAESFGRDVWWQCRAGRVRMVTRSKRTRPMLAGSR